MKLVIVKLREPTEPMGPGLLGFPRPVETEDAHVAIAVDFETGEWRAWTLKGDHREFVERELGVVVEKDAPDA